MNDWQEDDPIEQKKKETLIRFLNKENPPLPYLKSEIASFSGISTIYQLTSLTLVDGLILLSQF